MGEFTVYVSAAELTRLITSSYIVSVKNDAPTKDAGADLFPNASGSKEVIVDVVVPGVFCIGELYVNVRLVFSKEGTCAVDNLAVDILVFASRTPGAADPNFAISVFRINIFWFIS